MRSMSKKISRVRSKCVQETDCYQNILLFLMFFFAQLSVTPPLVQSVSNTLLAEITQL